MFLNFLIRKEIKELGIFFQKNGLTKTFDFDISKRLIFRKEKVESEYISLMDIEYNYLQSKIKKYNKEKGKLKEKTQLDELSAFLKIY